MKKALAVLILAMSTLAFSQSLIETCPYDGEGASIERTVGIGSQRVCWYGHQHMEARAGAPVRFVHHSFYMSCPQ